MSIAELRLIKRCAEYRLKEDSKFIPRNTRGIYALFHYRPRLKNFDLVYIGMARGLKSGIKSRIIKHKTSKKKSQLWTHFSVFEVWDNITDKEIEELEGLFRHLYKRDSKANKLNSQKRYHKLFRVRNDKFDEW